ncbi:MAG TPA: DUF523 domain-containing protein [Clostridia bacterium]|nr:DUF523 domain-containing protein [Clostridia bacterium]
MKILISACLLGQACRYDGKAVEKIKLDGFDLYPLCPEVLGGFSTPRAPSERRGERVINSQGEDVTRGFVQGAQRALDLMEKEKIQIALLKENSPSCGVHFIYDGNFSGKKVKGKGIFTELLLEKGYRVLSEEEIEIVKEERNGNRKKSDQ